MTCTRHLTFIKLCLGILVAAGALSGCRSAGAPEGAPPRRTAARRVAPRPMIRPVRGIWVARFHYRYPDDVRAIMANCAAAGCNTVYWQVRGEGTVCYPSRIEPWGREFDYKYPGFDPLALAVEEAHKHGLRIEAWFNVMPGWKGTAPPPIGSQVFNAHPEWFMHDANGQRQPLSREYVILNPCLPEVRRHITKVVDEIISRYDVDGIHLDYVRYAWDSTPNAKRAYPRDARTLGLYRHDTGRDPDDDLTAWDSWRANQLTRLVDDIRRTVNKRRPGATLTAAVWREPRIGYNDYLQNSVAWLRAGLVDALMPMVYTERFGQFEADIDSYKRLVGRHPIVPGLGLYMHTSDEVMAEQLRQCQSWGGDFALFSYESLFPTAGDRGANAAT
ncbi:MAG TPA: family 10 glycosylhydrolase, partial [Phycisphaerae bacterium]|nr:family 10 glycosylhydrolase [Phycisphaerae bacterium]